MAGACHALPPSTISATMNATLRLDDLPLPLATRCRLIVAACEKIDAAEKTSHAFAPVAVELSANLAGLQGPAGRVVTAKTMERLFYRWRNGGRKWQAIIDGRTATANAKAALTAQPRFRAHLAMLAGKHKRCMRSAIEELFTEWRTCVAIPGYEGMNYQPGMPLPHGWSVDNLLRKMPSKQALTVMRQGVGAAADLLPMVYSTREGCWPCSHVMFDDVWLDVLAMGYDERGRMQLGRPLQLGCLDMYTGRRLSWGTKLRTKAEDGHSLQLNSDEMLYLICDFLATVGYSRRGTTFIVEHGTAAISKEVEAMLAMLSHGCIKVERSGINGARQVGAFEGRGKGNPRFKAELEVWHSLLHNRMDGVLTQVGKNRIEPEQLHGIRKATEQLIKAGETLPPDRALLLAPYAPTLAELTSSLVQTVGAINARTDHALEGWEKCGFMVPEFSMTGQAPWTALHAMPAETQPMVQAMVSVRPELYRLRRMSPHEAWVSSLRQPGNELVRFTPAECVALMGAHRKFKLTARGGAFKLDSRARHHEQLLFETAVIDGYGNRRELPAGGEYWGVFNPFSQGLFVLDAKSVVLGAAELMHRVPHHDEAAKLRQFGQVMHRRTEALAAIDNMVAPLTAEAQARRAYNADVLAGKPADPLAIADARALANAPRVQRKALAAPLFTPPLLDDSGLADSYDNGTFN